VTTAASPHVDTASTASPPASGGSPLSFPGGPYDPLNAPGVLSGEAGGILGGAATSATSGIVSSLWSSIEPFLATALFVVFGLGLMGLGAYKIASPSVKRGAETIAPVAEDAGAAVGA
jgi:hypothetical protein